MDWSYPVRRGRFVEQRWPALRLSHQERTTFVPHFYVSAGGDAHLDRGEIASIADKKGGALLAVDRIDVSDMAAGNAPLPPKTADEKRDYLFFLEAQDQDTAQNTAERILDLAREERDKPVYPDLAQLLRAYPHASWREQIQAILLYDDEVEADLLLFVPGQSVNTPAKIYYRGSAASCCLHLLKHFTTIPVKH